MNTYKLLTLLVIPLLLVSCETKHTIYVYGEPGTEIYESKDKLLGKIESTGECKITLPDRFYCYLLSKEHDKDYYVPFALDYKKSSYNGAKFVNSLAYTIAGGGLAALVPGAIGCSINEDSSEAKILLIAGGGATMIGAFTGLGNSATIDSDCFAWQYKYLSNQSANTDFQFTKPDMKYIDYIPENSISHSGSKKFRIDFTKTNNFIGNGNLTLNEEIIENFQNVTVQLRKNKDGTIAVSIIESNGEDLFGQPLTYDVFSKDGGYKLVCVDIPSAVIEIRPDMSLKYVHPRIKIGDKMHELSINANLIKE